MAALVIAGFFVVASMVVVAIAFMGIGLAVRRAFGVRELEIDDCLMAFWTGYGLTTAFLLAWNFFLPVAAPALGIVLLSGGLGLLRSRRNVAACARRVLAATRFWTFAVLALALAWVIVQCLGEFRSWDGVLYHVQTVKWAKHFPVVPGIANLHAPLAFNQTSFLYDAMLDAGPWQGRAYHLANGVLAAAGLAHAIAHGTRWVQARRFANRHVFGFVMLAVVLHFGDHIASYSTDLPVALLLMVAAAGAYDLLDGSAANRSREARAYSFFAVGLLLVTAVTIKLTAAVFAVLTMAVLLGVSWRRRHAPSAKATTAILVMLSVMAAVWVARGVVMSGYPFFPLSAAGMRVDWRAPAEHADAEVAYAEHTERAFTWRFIGRNWVRLMLLQDVHAAAVPSLLAIAAVLMAWWRGRQASSTEMQVSAAWWLLLPIAASIAVWLATAPSHRYSPALFWSLAALCVAECQRRSAPAGIRTRHVVAMTIVLVSPVVLPSQSFRVRNLFTGTLHAWLPSLDGSVAVRTFTTDSGLELTVPVRDTARLGAPNACWDAPLPCTPNPAPNLRLRVPGDLSAGFRVDGDWQMQDWPYYWHSYFLPEWRRRR